MSKTDACRSLHSLARRQGLPAALLDAGPVVLEHRARRRVTEHVGLVEIDRPRPVAGGVHYFRACLHLRRLLHRRRAARKHEQATD